MRHSSSDAAPPVIILGEGITPLGVLRTLAADGIETLAQTTDPLLARSRWYHAAPGVPRAFDDESFSSWLADLEISRAVLMPCSDNWARRVAGLSQELQERFPASVSAPSVLNRFVDKASFSELLDEAGTPHPRTVRVTTADDLGSVPEQCLADAIIKPRDSQRFFARFGVKAFRVNSRDAAMRWLATAQSAGFEVVLQQYVPGPPTNHYFVDGFIDRNGAIKAVFVRQRWRMYPADFGNSTSMISVPPESAAQAIASVSALLQRAGYRGMFSAEFKRDANDGVFKIIEVNARAWWYVHFAARCGVDVCRMAYEDALGLPVSAPPPYAVGKRLVYPYYDLEAILDERRRGVSSFGHGVTSWIGAMQPVFQLRDPRPGVCEFFDHAAAFVSKRLRHARSPQLLPHGKT